MLTDLAIYTALIVSLIIGGFCSFRIWRLGRSWKSILYGIAAVLSIFVLISSGISFWYHHRPLPDNTQRTLFQGVEYIRDVRNDPRPLVIHIIRVDLGALGLEFLVTSATLSDDEQMFAARTTSDFLTEFGLQLAINGDFFLPWWSNAPWDYYPHIDDPVGTRGLSASQGIITTRGFAQAKDYSTLYISKENFASFDVPEHDRAIYNAISGAQMIVENGAPITLDHESGHQTALHPRTAIALDESQRRLIIVVVDGRQPNYSEGVTIPELVKIIIKYGGFTAQNMDGGGSTTLVIEDEGGQPLVLNSPIDNRIPGRERPVANHLGIYALPPKN
jgi:hypothetical protein